MSVLKKFFVGLLAVFALNFVTVAHAEEVDPYFEWEIKNLDDYQPYNLMFAAMKYDNGVLGMRDEIYKSINKGNYFQAATWCELMAATQKTVFGTDYFDAGLTELAAKLYLEAENFAAAERKINLLTDNAHDNLTKIRALNLASDFYNRGGNYHEALQFTQSVDELLKVTPDEKLHLVNRAHTARAYCGLDEPEKSLAMVTEIFPRMQNTFGEADPETLELMTTVAGDFFKLEQPEDSIKILDEKLRIITEHYGNQNLTFMAKTLLESAEVMFFTGDTQSGEEVLNLVRNMALKRFTKGDKRTSFQLYGKINDIASKHLDKNNKVLLQTKLGLARLNYELGDIKQSIEIFKDIYPGLKKVFGEQDTESLYTMKFLSDDYFALGRYSDAQKITADRLNFCRKNFGDNDKRTVLFTIDLAKIYYRTGKYKSADKLLEALEKNNRDLLEADLNTYFNFVFTEIVGARMKGAYDDYYRLANDELFQKSILATDPVGFMLESMNNGDFLLSGTLGKADYFSMMIKQQGMMTSNYHPNTLAAMNKLAETYSALGNFADAEKFAKRVVKLSRIHFGENNFFEWTALDTLSKIYRAEKKFVDALAIDKQALQVAEKVCGKNSLERMQSLDSIASDYAGVGNLTEAIKIRERTLTEYKTILEDSDAATNQMMTNLAENYLAAKKYDDAVDLCDEAFSLQKVPWFYEKNNVRYVSLYPCVTDLLKIKGQARKLSGDNAMASTNYQNLILAYELKRNYLHNLVEYDDETKSRWFAEMIPDYKDAAFVAASDNGRGNRFAFYCTEFCKGRNLIDRFDNVLVAKNYLLTPEERNTLDAHENFMKSSRAVSEYAEATDDDELFFNNEYVYLYLYINTGEFKKKLREKYSKLVEADANDVQKPDREFNILHDLILKRFDVKKNQAIIPQGACLIEFMKIAEDSLTVTFLRNEGDVQATNVHVEKNFFDRCELYHELNSYATISELNYHGKYLWQVDGEYVITVGRNEPSPEAVAIKAVDDKDNSTWLEIRQKISAELSEQLMPTLEKFAGTSSHWIISPDAELNFVPFETLTYRDKMLIESVNLSYVPSLAVMNLMENRGRENAYLGRSREFFAMGDAVYGNTAPVIAEENQPQFSLRSFQWNELRYTSFELDKVSELFTNKSVFRREQVTEKNLWSLNIDGELSEYRYLLFATHGLFVPEKPELSSIVLSQTFNDAQYDGYVTVGEWMNYDLRSDLVYLSACESGRGYYRAGEGIVGIPYALTVAGNKDTVMSLWKVKDAATAEFTSTVFEKLRDGKSEVDALNETKREFLKHGNTDYRDPSIWAAFLLYGI